MALAPRRRTTLSLTRFTDEMNRFRRLRTQHDHERFAELLGAVSSRASAEWFLAVLDTIVLAEDHGVYETVYTTLWKFPPATYGTAMVRGLPKLLRRMNRYQQVERFLIGVAKHPRHRRAFVAAFKRAPDNDQRSIRNAFREWSRQSEAWNPLLRELGGTPFRAPARKLSAEEPKWPAKWQRFYADFMSGRVSVDFWEWRSRRESARFAAHLLGRPLGEHWRRAEAFTNPLFLSFATRYFGDFLGELEKLEPKAQRLALSQLVKVRRNKAPAGDWPEIAARTREIDRLVRARRSK